MYNVEYAHIVLQMSNARQSAAIVKAEAVCRRCDIAYYIICRRNLMVFHTALQVGLPLTFMTLFTTPVSS